MKRYPIAESDREYAGGAIQAERTGETRRPKQGEWYLSGGPAEAWYAPRNLTTSFHIVSLVVYCRPSNCGLNSQTSSVARRLGKLFDALDTLIDKQAVSSKSGILSDIKEARDKIRDGLEAEGWTVGYTKGDLEASNKCRVYAPDSPTGEKILKWRASR